MIVCGYSRNSKVRGLTFDSLLADRLIEEPLPPRHERFQMSQVVSCQQEHKGTSILGNE